MTDYDAETHLELLFDRLAPLMSAHERMRAAPYGSPAEAEARAEIMGAVADLRMSGLKTIAEREAMPSTPAREQAKALDLIMSNLAGRHMRPAAMDG